jgi:hypothetical protein
MDYLKLVGRFRVLLWWLRERSFEGHTKPPLFGYPEPLIDSQLCGAQ